MICFLNLFKIVPTRCELQASNTSSCKDVPQDIILVKDPGPRVQLSNPTPIMEGVIWLQISRYSKCCDGPAMRRKLVQIEIRLQTWDVAVTFVSIGTSGRGRNLGDAVSCCTAHLQCPLRSLEDQATKGPHWSAGGRHLQQEGISLVGWSRTRCCPTVREGAALCQEGCGGMTLLWVHQPHSNREQPTLSMGLSFP